MSIGMTYEQYWYGTPFMVKAFEKAQRIRLQEQNTFLWLQARYFYDALNSSLSYALGSKTSKKVKYPEKPYDILPKTKEEKEREAIEARKKVIAQLNAFKESWDRNHKNKITKGGDSFVR